MCTLGDYAWNDLSFRIFLYPHLFGKGVAELERWGGVTIKYRKDELRKFWKQKAFVSPQIVNSLFIILKTSYKQIHTIRIFISLNLRSNCYKEHL